MFLFMSKNQERDISFLFVFGFREILILAEVYVSHHDIQRNFT